MAFESLNRIRNAAEEVQNAMQEAESVLQRLLAALKSLPESIRAETSEEAFRILSQAIDPLTTGTVANGDSQGEDREGEFSLPAPTQAILDLLRQHPGGLVPGEIVAQIRGKFQTSTPREKQDHLIYATLSALRKKGTIQQDQSGRHVICPPPSPPPADKAEEKTPAITRNYSRPPTPMEGGRSSGRSPSRGYSSPPPPADDIDEYGGGNAVSGEGDIPF